MYKQCTGKAQRDVETILLTVQFSQAHANRAKEVYQDIAAVLLVS